MANIDPKLLEWATDREKEIIETIERTGSAKAADRELGTSPGLASKAVKLSLIHI